ncbi:MAG: hypothetical protein H2172_16230 [Opitutus sp.]|nr:hypothetical protein [Opitutus sp.]MCS6244630.1 hypothetical protein [Opitutus sp.]MCS6244647.1 hypothetical protein [Opitutus sp.]MCS6245380.1 hypothetical protein [Opitutus sp.]MCS6248189.1 hypothetical protein [Opitutus sp.]
MPNAFIDLQSRLAALLAVAFPTDTILTEKLGDLPQQIETTLLNIGFGIVVTTARGTAQNLDQAGWSQPMPLVFQEELTVAVIHAPLLKTDRNTLDAVSTAIAALHNQPVAFGQRSTPLIRVTGHELATDAPDGVVVHHLLVRTVLPFSV